MAAASGHGQDVEAEDVGTKAGGADSNTELHWDTATALEHQRSNGRELEGVAADRTGGNGRVSVQVRIPLEHEEPSESGLMDVDSETSAPADAVQQTAGDDEDAKAAAPADLKGIGLVEFFYRALPQEEQAMSANSLAPVLAERTGYKVGTVRKYLGSIKKA